MQLKATDIRRGMVISMDNVYYVVVDFMHHTPGNLRAMVQTKLRNMNSGSLIEKRFRSVDQIEVPYVETKEFEYLYSSGDEHVFMDTETYDQLQVSPETVGEAANYLLEGQECVVALHEGSPLYVELPASVELVIEYTEPGIQGDRSTGGTKPARLETGYEVSVPLFITNGEKVKVDTRTGEYLGRVNS